MKGERPRRPTEDSARAAARVWLKNPENRRAATEIARRNRLNEPQESRARRSAMERFGREVARLAAGGRRGTCAICSDEFELNLMGRPRKYCEKCVTRFVRSSRKCPGCDSVMPISRRRLTCPRCGTLWGTKGDGKI